MQLSAHFNLIEFTRSQTASRLGIINTPSKSQIKNLMILCEKILEPTRAYFNKPIIITSGYRCPELNQRIGGSSSSQHCQGQAADFHIKGVDNYTLAYWIWKNLNYDQLILEFYQGGQSGWVHCSYKEPYRNQELTINKRGAFQGLIKY